ncbi:MAG TPA: hypothetical protein IAC14_11085 [Candidatus Scybalomonas excrementigallinarum]|nr:hypothetical protein [Candidatus Scybalomonas excrementigallinarum]
MAIFIVIAIILLFVKRNMTVEKGGEVKSIAKEQEEQQKKENSIVQEITSIQEGVKQKDERWNGKERGVEVKGVALQQGLQEGDRIDIRIRYPDGEEYVVIAQRGCYDVVIEENTMTMWLLEEEMLRLASSMVDCEYMNGILYTVRYRRDMKQESSTVNYIPKEAVYELMKNNPNVVEKAQISLWKKYRQTLEENMRLQNKESEKWNLSMQEQNEEQEHEEVVYFD